MGLNLPRSGLVERLAQAERQRCIARLARTLGLIGNIVARHPLGRASRQYRSALPSIAAPTVMARRQNQPFVIGFSLAFRPCHVRVLKYTWLVAMKLSNIDKDTPVELQRELAKQEYGYARLGLVLGLICMLGGIALFVNGIAGSSSWTAKTLGAESKITDTAPGGLLFFAGIAVVWITRPRFEHNK